MLSLLLPFLFFLCLPAAHAQKARPKKPLEKLTAAAISTQDLVYKSTPQGELKLHFFLPTGHSYPARPDTTARPCVVFFFGGGWRSGNYTQFVPQAEYLASRGLVAACADYRILNEHKTLPDKAVEDAKSAIRWVRSHANELGILPNQIVAAGGSAGGHLAACTALTSAYDATTDDTSVSARPNAMVLFNPAMNIGTLFRERSAASSSSLTGGMTQEMADAITPNNFLQRDTPPAILFFGTADKLKQGGDEYVQKAHALGLVAEMWSAEGMPHGFFNRAPWLQTTTRQMDLFLTKLGYLTGSPKVVVPDQAPALKAELSE